VSLEFLRPWIQDRDGDKTGNNDDIIDHDGVERVEPQAEVTVRSPDNNEIQTKDMATAVLESDGHATKSEHYVPESEQNPREDDAKVPDKEEPSGPEPEQKSGTTNDKDKVRTQKWYRACRVVKFLQTINKVVLFSKNPLKLQFFMFLPRTA
jgi:hypothetical protein